VTETACRSCGSLRLSPILSLGALPLANALPPATGAETPDARFPLDLAFCEDCSLVQITETVAPEILFRDYLYFSSFSDTFVSRARTLAERLVAERGLTAKSLVVEIASNDGYLLQHYVASKIPVLGIEPAENVAAVAREKGIPTRADFFSKELADRLKAEGNRADVVHANNVLAHVADLNGFVSGIAAILKESGVAVVEMPYVLDMVDRCEFDTIYHEHLCYFSLKALTALFERHGLTIQKVERLPVHGGSLRLFVGHETGVSDDSVERLRSEEIERAADRFPFYEAFGDRVARLKTELVALLRRLRRDGKSIAAYGAAAKGTVLLNYFEIGTDLVSFVVDRNPHKQGRLVPGVRIPIRGAEAVLASQPDYVLLLVWNLAEEVLGQQAEYRTRGGKFIVPIPDVRVL